jgi:hypothetical protein
MDAINPAERRTVNRHPGNTIEPVRLRLDAGEFEFVAKVHDISVVGIGILTRQHLEPGTWLVLEPAEPSRKLSPELRAEVRHLRTGDEGEYLVGCRFSRPLLMEDVMALG